MVNTYAFLKNVFQNLINENKNNNAFIPTILVLVTIPLSFAINNIALALFTFIALFTFRKNKFSFQSKLIIPIFLYLLMVLSCFWSIDTKGSLEALSKELPLLLIPISFLIFNFFSIEQKQKIIAVFSYSMLFYVLYYYVRAIVRYALTNDTRAFFYHGEDYDDYGLVPKLLNAIHVSVFVAVAFFHFFTKEIKSKRDIGISILLFGFVLLLSSKNVVLIIIILLLVYLFFFSKSAHKMRLRNLILFMVLIGLIFSFGRIKQRFEIEFQTNTNKSINANVVEGIPATVHNVSLKEAWTNEKFTPNDYFNGTAFRIYQFRIFIELINENNIFFTGLGLNASYPKIEEKARYYNLYLGKDGKDGYQNKNFHNQYIQNFAELGILGFLLLVIMLLINLKNALKSKDFVHFAFAILMISLFLTESFLWRQRGVVFFTMIYCLFNSVTKLRDSPKAE
jgi:O-antigen ligase